MSTALALLFIGFLPAPLPAGAETSQPPPEAGDAAADPAPAASGAEADPLVFDTVELWMAHYHLDPAPEQIPTRIKALQERGAFAPGAPRVREYLRFFSAALATDPGAVAMLKRAADTTAGQEKSIFMAIAAKSAHYAPAVPQSPEDLPLLWAEYRATGRTVSITAIIELVGLPKSADPHGLMQAATDSLLENVPRHVGARQILNASFQQAPEPLKIRLAPIAASVNQWYNLALTLDARGSERAREKQPAAALEAFRAAMATYPAFYRPYHNAADLYLAAGRIADYQQALAAMQIAATLAPDNAQVLNRLGRVAFRMGLLDQATTWFRKAQECNPRIAYAPLMLGKISFSRNDHEAALRHFTRYARLESAGRLLSDRERRFVLAAGVTIGAAEPAPADLLLQQKYAALEERLAALSRGKQKEPGGESAAIKAFERLAALPGPENSSVNWVRRFRDWAGQRPGSAVAATALGVVLVEHAWETRGADPAEPAAGYRERLFGQRLLEARGVLERAWQLDPGNPTGATYLIRVARGLDLGRDEMERQYQRVLQADDTIFEPAVEKLSFLLSAGQGSTAEALAFARAAAAAAPAGSAVPLVLASVHVALDQRQQEISQDSAYFRNAEVWSELRPVLERHLSAFPEALTTRNWLAWIAYRAGDLETARRELRSIGDEWDPAVWKNFTALKRVRKALAAAFPDSQGP